VLLFDVSAKRLLVEEKLRVVGWMVAVENLRNAERWPGEDFASFGLQHEEPQ
jgi:hypothetical protein